MKTARQIDVPVEKMAAYLNMAKMYAISGHIDSAFDYTRRYIALKDSVYDQRLKQQIIEVQTKYETEKVEKDNRLLSQEVQLNEIRLEQRKTELLMLIFLVISITGAAIFLIYRRNQKQKAALDAEVIRHNKEQLKAVITGQEKERRHIARELHDSVGQRLAAIKLGVVFLFDRKAGKDQIACIDLTDGKLLWTTDKYQKVTADMIVYIPEDDGFAISLKKELVYVKARTGEEIWTTNKFHGVVGKYVYNKKDQTMIMVNFIPNGIVAFFTGFKNQIVKIDMKTGSILWENTYTGRADRKTVTRDFVYNLDVDGDKVMLRLAGIQLYDYNTGATLWSAAFDYTPEGVIHPGKNQIKFGVYGTVADPVIDGDDIYVLDMTSKKSQYIKKYDYNTGKLIWTSNEIKGAKVIPGMIVKDGVIVIQVGGLVEIQYYQKIVTQYYTATFPVIRYKGIKPYGIQAFNAEDGSNLWSSERFKKGITNALSFGGNNIVCSGKALYSLDLHSGEEKYEVPVSKGGVGLAQMILPYGDNTIVVVGDKGLSTFKASDGSFIKNAIYKKSVPSGKIGDLVLMKTDKDDFAVFNMKDLSYKQYNARKGAQTSFEKKEGRYVYVYDKSKVIKLGTF